MKAAHRSILPSFSHAVSLLLGCAVAAAIPESSANILPEGAFDKQEGQFFAGWKPGGFLGGSPAWNNAVTMEAEQGGTAFARIKVKDEKGTNVAISQSEKLVLNPVWKTITLKVLVRMTEYQKVADWGGRGQLIMKFSDDNDKHLPAEVHLGINKNTAGWEELSKDFAIPPGAASMVVEVQFMGATGVMDVKNLRALPAPTQ